MFSNALHTISFFSSAAKTIARARMFYRMTIVIIPLALMAMASNAAQQTPVNNTISFFQNIVGEWIGTCEQSTDGEEADDKYFHAFVKQLNDNTFSTKFDYYRIDKETNTPLRIGETTVTTVIGPDGAAKSKITGKGIILVNDKPKNQTHELHETLVSTSNESLQGEGNGKISVSGMPLGLGKNGKVGSSKSDWSLNDGVLNIRQTISASFKALFFKKTFDVAANYTAKRGSNVASLWSPQSRSASK